MNESKNNMCRIPIHGTMQIINGEPVMIEARYTEIPAEIIARYLVERFGVDAILGAARVILGAGEEMKGITNHGGT